MAIIMTITVRKIQYIIGIITGVPQLYISAIDSMTSMPSITSSLSDALTFDIKTEAELALAAQNRSGYCNNCKVIPVNVTLEIEG
jgi:hypothetical protein